MKQIQWLLLAVGLAFAGPASAHESAQQGHKAQASIKEQKAWGIAGDARAVRRTVEITMSDAMRFTPDRIEVRQGEVLKLVVRNGGKLLHELVIGTPDELAAHAALMQKFPDMAHDEPYMIHVKPGAFGPLVWNFNRVGEFKFACLIPGHYQAGMTGTIVVTAGGKKS